MNKPSSQCNSASTGAPSHARPPVRQPGEWLQAWLTEAKAAGEAEPTAMALASVGEGGSPTLRFVLCKAVNERGVRFFTNLNSVKGRELLATPQAAVAFHWPIVGRQVRLEGRVELVPPADADAYYCSRDRLSQIGAWASQQSQPLAKRQDLLDAVDAYSAQFAESQIPRPPHWSGFELVASRWEFWEQGPGRLHERWTMERAQTGWLAWQLFP